MTSKQPCSAERLRLTDIAIVLVTLVVLSSGCRSKTRTPDRRNPAPPAASIPTTVPVAASKDATSLLLGGVTVTLEIADDSAERARGLAGRTSLTADHGMVFVYPRAADRDFWMKGCLIGLDIAYVDSDYLIFQVDSLDAPRGDGDMPSLKSRRPAQFVVEMEKGWFARHGVVEGTKLAFDAVFLAGIARADP